MTLTVTAPAPTIHLGPHGPEVTPPPGRPDAHAYLEPPGRVGSLGSLAHYEVIEVLGQGGFGTVFRAFDEKLRRPVAIKALDPVIGATSPARKGFLREARAAAMVRHENVVHTYAVEETPIPYLVMEYVDGRTLQHRLDSHGPLPADEIVALGVQICAGLAAAHDGGLVHRDVKPANILIESAPAGPRVKLTDFGIARAADDASQTRSGAVVGTPMFMAPEQAAGGTVDARSDLFSLGSVLYALASGRPPFRAPTSLAVMNRVAHDTPRPIRQIVPEVPRALCAVIAKLHAKDPARRYADAREAGKALEACLRRPPGAAEPAGWGRAAPTLLACAAAVLASLAVGKLTATAPTTAVAAVPAPELPPASAAPLPPPLPVDDAWVADVAAKPAGVQLRMVYERLRERNPRFDQHRATPNVVDGKVVGLEMNGNMLADLSPLRGFPDLVDLNIVSFGEASRLNDLSGLRGLRLARLSALNNPIDDLSPLEGMPLTELWLWGHTVTDLSPLKGMPLRMLNCGAGPVGDLSPLKGLPLDFLCANCTQIQDLTPLAGMPLTKLMIETTLAADATPLKDLPLDFLATENSKITDYGPVRHLPLKTLSLNFDPARDARWLREKKTLEEINHRPAAEFLAAAAAGPPPDPAWMAAVAKMRPEDQIAEVGRRMKEVNPRFDPADLRIAGVARPGGVAAVDLRTEHVTDLSPLRALPALEDLELFAPAGAGKLSDLSGLRGLKLGRLVSMHNPVEDLTPLAGMPLDELCLWSLKTADLTPLKGMRLTHLNCGDSPVRSLAPLAGMPLTFLCANGSQVNDLTPLKGMPLKRLLINGTPVADLSPLAGMKLKLLEAENLRTTDLSVAHGMPIKELVISYDEARDGEWVRALPALEKFNRKPKAETLGPK